MDSRLIACHPDIRRALTARQPVVALESTLMTHGLPAPVNLQTARQAEQAIRDQGAAPATIAILDGLIQVGLTPAQLEALASAPACVKASRRDIAAAIAMKQSAATTISATLAIGRAVGIQVMASGGLGGVHQGASTSFDVSTDLDELARADGMLVVTSGAKSLLDLPANMQALETRGVLVVGYRTRTLPAFTARSSGLPLEWSVDDPLQAATIWMTHRALNLPGGMLLTQAVPEAFALDDSEAENALRAAHEQSALQNIAGKQVTTFLLEQVRQRTAGRSLVANQALIVANAALAAQVAIESASLS